MKIGLFNTEKGELSFEEVNLESSRERLDYFYEKIGCDLIDIAYYKGFDIVVDDEGLLKENFKISLFDSVNENIALAGNLVFVGHDEEGETIGLTEEQIFALESIPIFYISLYNGYALDFAFVKEN